MAIGLAAAGGAILAAATVLMRGGIEPFATWFYPFAWYSTFLVAETAVALRDGRFFMLDRPSLALSLFGWSIPFWLFFEILNFRLANWYYVFVPDHPVARWSGIAISFATVLPAIFLAERVLRSYGPWRVAPGGQAGTHGQEQANLATRRGQGTHLGSGPLLALQAAGLAFLVLPLVWPRYLFPLVWVGVTLVADPWVYRRDPSRSLIAELEDGRPRRSIRLLVGGMAIGLLWELFNFGARGKWIYTVPGLEDLKLFEMPILGFFGFPFLALEGWSAYQVLVVAELAVDPSKGGDSRPAPVGEEPTHHHREDYALPRLSGLAVILAAVFSALVLRGLEIETIDSYSPRLSVLAGVPPESLREAGYGDVFALARADPERVAAAMGADPARAQRWIEQARLATLRGIGTENAAHLRRVGVGTIAELAAVEADELARRLKQSGSPVPSARLRIWIRAAHRE